MAELSIEIKRDGETVGKIEISSDKTAVIDDINALTTRELIDFCRGFNPADTRAVLTTKSGLAHQLNRNPVQPCGSCEFTDVVFCPPFSDFCSLMKG